MVMAEERFKESMKSAGLVTAKLDSDFLDIEAALQGTVHLVDVTVLGKTFVFGPIDAAWEIWIAQNTDQSVSLEGIINYAEAARVAASMVGIRESDGSIKNVVDMFTPDYDSMDPEVREVIKAGSTLIREQWCRKQLLNWLRSGSAKSGRSAQHSEFLMKLYSEGALPAMRQQEKELQKLDPSFGLLTTQPSSGEKPKAENSESGPSEATS